MPQVSDPSTAIVPDLPPNVPRRNRRLLQRFGRLGMRLLRWSIDGQLPNLPKFVVIVAPHTSNWDFVVGLCCDLALDMDVVWLGKHTIFVGPFGRWLKSLGGMPVDRSGAHNVVAQVAAEFARRDQMILGLTPEGTRRKVDAWRSGYWHIARAAGVPILPVGFDYARRAAVIGTPHPTTESIADDERALRAFFDDITPRHPHLR